MVRNELHLPMLLGQRASPLSLRKHESKSVRRNGAVPETPQRKIHPSSIHKTVLIPDSKERGRNKVRTSRRLLLLLQYLPSAPHHRAGGKTVDERAKKTAQTFDELVGRFVQRPDTGAAQQIVEAI